MTRATDIVNNSAIFGGGVYCENNSANDSGGGVYATDGGMLYDLNNECFGNEDHPASVYGNQADTDTSGFESGGRLYASGVNSDVTIVAGHMYENSNNSGFGGAIALFENARLTITRPRQDNFALSCWSSDRCNLFNANTAIA